MNALKSRRRYDAEQEEKRIEEEVRKEEQKILAMTPDERSQYETEKRKRYERMFELLGAASAMTSNKY